VFERAHANADRGRAQKLPRLRAQASSAANTPVPSPAFPSAGKSARAFAESELLRVYALLFPLFLLPPAARSRTLGRTLRQRDALPLRLPPRPGPRFNSLTLSLSLSLSL
jgi:hypothetical protein